MFEKTQIRSSNTNIYNMMKQCHTSVDTFTKYNVRCISQVLNKPVISKTEQVDYIKSAMLTDKLDWDLIRNRTLEKPGIINNKNIDAVILKLAIGTENFNAALSFINHIRSSNKDLSLGVINGLLHFYVEYSKRNNLTDEEKTFILHTYEELHNKYKILDSYTSEKLLHALCCIDEWKKCLKLLDDICLTSKPSHSAYSTLIGTLYKNNKKSEAVKLTKRSLGNGRPLLDYAYEEWIKYILRKYKDKNTIIKYLNEICAHFVYNYVVITEKTSKLLQDTYKSLDWDVKYTEINKNSGLCKVCNTTLACSKLSAVEFELLQKNVKEKLIVGSDLFLKTSPEELSKFLNFVEQTKPYDIVIDALNVAYAVGRGRHDKIKLLTTVVDRFFQQNKKILLLGRKHMLGWNKGLLKYLGRTTCSFFTDDISQDDPYFITAAILSGPQTDIVSRDLLRGHCFILKDEELQRIFQRWQWEHQWMVYAMRQKPFIQAPLTFTPCAQKTGKGWHLPYEKENFICKKDYNDGIPDCSSWLCLMPKIKR